MESSKKTVLITGITGFLGSHVCKVFLEHGGYHVKGTVRDKNNKDKIDPIRVAFGTMFDTLELVEADLLDSASIDRAIEGSSIVIHTASPFVAGKVKNADSIIKPAVEGTQAVLDSCVKHKVK